MLKLLLLLAAVIGGLWWFARAGRRPRSSASPAEAMARCEYCNVHVPDSEAVRSDDHTFCSDEHRRAAGY